MTTDRMSRVTIAVIAAVLPTLAGAANLSFLKNTPYYYFTEQDLQLMFDTANQVLNDPNPTVVREWSNPKNKYSGKVEGLGSVKSTDGLQCRKLRIWTQAKGLENLATYPVCKTAQGEWQLSSGRELVKQ